MSFLRGFSIAMGANAILFVLSFLNNKLIYISLSQKDNGIYFLVMRFSLLLNLFWGEWLRLTNINIAGRHKHLNPVLSSNTIVYTGIIGVILAGTAFYHPGVLKPFFPGLPLYFYCTVVMVSVCFMIKNAFQSLMLVNNRMIRFGTTIVIWGILFLVLDFVFLVVYDLGLQFVIYALIISSAFAALWAFISSVTRDGYSLKPSLKVFGMSGKLGARAAVAVLGMFLMINIHTFAIEPLSGKSGDGLVMVGIFSVCFRVFQLFQRGSDITGSILYADVARNAEKAGFKKTMLVCRNIILFSVLFGVFTGLFGKPLIIIIAKSTYLEAYIPLLLMLPGIVAMNTGTVLNSSYWGRGYPFKVIVSSYCAAVVGLVLDIVLIPQYGACGAALSFSVMSVLWFLYILEVFRRDSGFKMSEIVIPHYADIEHIMRRMKIKLSKGEK